jgi:nucleoid-associated protein YgaU
MLIAEAKTVIAEAKQAGAEKYAKELLDSAESKLVIAEDALAKTELETAVTFAGKSLEDAKAAKTIALASGALEKAETEIKSAEEAGAEKLALELLNLARKDLLAAQKLHSEKDYAGVLEPAKKAYEEAAEAKRLCELVKKAETLIAEAKKDIKEAVNAGAKKYAPELIKSAEDNLAKATASYDEKDYIKAIDYASKASDDARAAKSACVAASAGKYTVKSGDNLWNIAKDGKVLDNPFLWPLIYKTNREKIKDPELIFPTQEFELPASFDDNTKKDAIGDAFKYKGK